MRDDFVVSTSNKQLNFIQHVMTTLKPGGRAAIVVPDNVLFADQAGDVFRATWIYDARANVPAITKKSRPLTAKYFEEFEHCYGGDPNGHASRDERHSVERRWRSFALDEIKDRHYKLDAFKWLRDEEADDPNDLPEPEELITEAMEELKLALDDLVDVQLLVEGNGGAT